MDTLLIIDALDVNGVPVTLRFSQQLTVDAAGNGYEPRISAPAQLTVSPNDGGVLAIFKAASVGDIRLINVDGGLDFLADTALDGRAARLLAFDGVSGTVRFEGTVGRMSWQDDGVTLSLRARSETLSGAHPMAIYAGDNALPAGLGGTEETIGGTVKPKVFGDVRNIAAVLVNEALLIYQASSLGNCRITAVYDEGVRLADYYVQGAHSAGAVVIALHWGVGAIPADSEVVFSNHATIYTVAVALGGGVLTLTGGLTVGVAAGAKLDVVNFYTETALQLTNYLVNGDHAKGAATIALDSGTGAVNAGDLLVFNTQAIVYEVVAGLAAGVVVLDSGLAEALSAGTVVSVLGASPAHWGAYQGYFRLTAPPSGMVTCDAVSIDETGAVHQAGDVFALVAAEVGLSVEPAGVAEFNAVGTLGLFVGESTPTLTLFNKLAASVLGFYTVINTVVSLHTLQAPSLTPILTLEHYQLLAISRVALGLGGNGLPVYRVAAKFDRIEATQAQVAGAVSNARRQRLALAFREVSKTDAAVLTRHLLASVLTIESLLRKATAVNTLLTRALNLVKPRRDVVDLTLDSTAIAWPALGDTVRVVSRYLGYGAGRNLVVIGYDIDDLNRTLTLRLFGWVALFWVQPTA